MKKIDELVQKILLLKPMSLHENADNKYYLFYKDITLCFWNMDKSLYSDNIGLVKINSNDACNISAQTKKEVLKYFKKPVKLDDLLTRIDREIRKEKLLTIESV